MTETPLCLSPWTNLDIDPSGNMSPCCKFQPAQDHQRYNITQHTIQQYRDSQDLAKIKTQMQQGEWPTACERCRIEEQHGIPSKRLLDAERWAQHYQTYRIDQHSFITASVAFGNTCNLKCITCGPQSSSAWQKEYRAVYGIQHDNHRFYRQGFVDDFLQHAPDLVHIDVPGGEPFISGVPQQQDLLDRYIQAEVAHRISLHYTTNATLFPDQSWWNRWQHFREIDLQISVDGVKEKFEYIRFPAQWSEVVSNIERYQTAQEQNTNFKISVSHTVSAYNILYLDLFYQWCIDQGLPAPWLGRVHRPLHMRPSVWTDEVRRHITQRLEASDFDAVRQWAQLMQHSDDSQYFPMFVQRTRQHDAYRGTSFDHTFPELAPYL